MKDLIKYYVTLAVFLNFALFTTLLLSGLVSFGTTLSVFFGVAALALIPLAFTSETES